MKQRSFADTAVRYSFTSYSSGTCCPIWRWKKCVLRDRFDVPVRGLELNEDVIPDESTILKFRCYLEQRGLAVKILETVNAHLSGKSLLLRQGAIVDVTIIQALGLVRLYAFCTSPRLAWASWASSTSMSTLKRSRAIVRSVPRKPWVACLPCHVRPC